MPFLATEENTNRGLTDAWLSQDGKFTATGPAVIMSAVRSCNNVDIDCARRNLRCIEDYTRKQLFLASTRRYFTPPSPSTTFIIFLSLHYCVASNRIALLFLSLSFFLSIAILNPFSSPEDEDWIGRNVRFFRWNCRERKGEGMYIQDGGNVASSPRFVRVYFSGRSLEETNATFFFVPDIRTFVD